MIPREAVGHLCLLVWANDEDSQWSAGLIRISDAILNPGKNLDSKRTISAANRPLIRWLFDHDSLPPNILLQLPRATVDNIMALPSGQKRVNEIFRVTLERRIGRGVIATLAQQVDYMKRVRGNGGARSVLKGEGIIILGQYDSHRRVAQELCVPVPGEGESVSVRVTRASGPRDGTTEINGTYWRIAADSDPVEPAPDPPFA